MKENEKGKGTTYNNGVLVARGGRENSNPATTTTHSGTVEKETHFINVVGKRLGNNIENGGAKIVVYLKWGFGEWAKLAIRILKRK